MNITLRILALVLALLLLPGFGSLRDRFAPDAELWLRWTAHDATAGDSIDHGIWDDLLSRYVVRDQSGLTLVDYGGFTAGDRARLDEYVEALARTPISRFRRDEQLAFWINLYNALTVDLVLDHYPVDSIRDIDISPGLFARGPWGRKLVAVEGERISLNDIEHRILRPVWKDPRIHYAINCAAIGCPILRSNAYAGGAIHEALDEAARQYVSSSRGVAVSNGKVTVSRIYAWFIEDFGGTEQGVLRHLLEYAEPGLAARLVAIGKLHDTQYDWSLNAVR